MKYEFKGTPGPWRIHEVFPEPISSVDENGRGWSHKSDWIKSGSGQIIGDVMYQSYGAGYPPVDSLPEMQANAQLIASAPDLLKVCIEALKDYESHSYRSDIGKELYTTIRKALNIQ